MPKRRSNRTMKGGFLDSLSNTLSSWGSSFSQGASSAWEKTKSSVTGSTPSTTSYQTPSYTSTFGGRRSRRRRHMRGGFKDNAPTTGIAANAASFSGKTAQPQTIVGGRTRRRGRKGGFIAEAINQAVVPMSILAMQQKYRSKKRGGKTRRH
jgi:hypothetical protein